MASEVIQVEILESGKDLFDYLLLASDVLVAPIVAAIFGYWLLRITKRLEHSQWRNQKLIEKRIDLWDQIGPTLNDVYCYFMRVGSWKSFSPPDIVKKKREVDKLVYLAGPYFSDKFSTQYHHFIAVCFDTNQGHGKDAKLKTMLSAYKDVRDDWDNQWDQNFMQASFDENKLKNSYAQLIKQLRSELNASD